MSETTATRDGWQAWLDRHRLHDLRRLWSMAEEAAGGTLVVPHGAPKGEDGFDDGVIAAFYADEHYLEIETMPDGTWEWFYKNRETGEVEGEEKLALGLMPHTFAPYAKRLLAPATEPQP